MQNKPKLPLISVILPNLNAGSYLPKCLDSLLLQSYPSLEIIAIDDHSVDNSYTILRKYARKHKQLKVFRNVKRYGSALTLNRALKKAKGDFIAFMAPTDCSNKERLAKQVKHLLNNPKLAAVGTQCSFLNEKGKTIAKSNFPQQHSQIYNNPILGTSVLFEGLMINKKRLPKDTLHFKQEKETVMYSDVLMKVLQYGQIENLNLYLYARRLHNESESMLRSVVQAYSTLNLWIRFITQHAYKPSLKTLFPSILKTNLRFS